MRLQISRVSAAVLAGIITAGALFVPVSAASNPILISLQTGQSVLLKTPDIERVAVGDGHIAGVVPLGSSQIVVNGKAPGHTVVFVWYSGTRATYEVTVTEQQVDDLARMLRTSITNSGVQVVSFNKSVVVRGVVQDGAQFQSIADIIARFDKTATENHYTIVNAVQVAHPLGDMQQRIAGMTGTSDIRVDPDGKGNVIVSGRVVNSTVEQGVLQQARSLAGPYLAADGKLIDRLAVDQLTQIDVKVQVVEVDDTATKNLGLQLQSAQYQSGNPFQYVIGPPSFPVVEQPQLGGGWKIGPFWRTITLAPTLNLLLQEGHAKILSQPDLVTTPGNLATFLVGGQIPIPYSTGIGQISILYKDFGVRLNVTPALLANGAVESKIAPEVSDLDWQDAVLSNGFAIPALKTSKLETDIVTKPGQSIVMGGLLRRVEQRTINKIPLLGDLPVLGQLFRSTSYQHSQTDVVFVMTPQLVQQ